MKHPRWVSLPQDHAQKDLQHTPMVHSSQGTSQLQDFLPQKWRSMYLSHTNKRDPRIDIFCDADRPLLLPG